VESSILRHILLEFDGDNFNGGLSGKLRPVKLSAIGKYPRHGRPNLLSLLQKGMPHRLQTGFKESGVRAVASVDYQTDVAALIK